jgi:hypothetical protein
MKLLVSVSNDEEARAAVDGGADIIDAKDPLAGALGAVDLDVFAAIRRVVGPHSTVTAALGDATEPSAAAGLADAFVRRGADLVKIGFADIVDRSQIESIIASAARACKMANTESGVVAVAYADTLPDECIDARTLMGIAARAGGRGVLIDTTHKNGAGLTSLWDAARIARWVVEATDLGLIVAVAGKLALEDLDVVHRSGAAIAGVRGAACIGGRRGRVATERVRALVARCHAERSAPTNASTSSAWTMTDVTSEGSARLR